MGQIRNLSRRMVESRFGIVVPHDLVHSDPGQSARWIAQGRDPVGGRMIVGRVPAEHIREFLWELHRIFPEHQVEGVSEAVEHESEEPDHVFLVVTPDLNAEQFEEWKVHQRKVADARGLITKTQQEKAAELERPQ